MKKIPHEEGKKTRFKKGQSGNPSGRPKGSINIKTRINNFLEKTATEEIVANLRKKKILDKEEKQNIDALIAALFISALEGNSQNTKLLLEYGFGKPEQPISTQEDKPIEITFTRID